MIKRAVNRPFEDNSMEGTLGALEKALPDGPIKATRS